MTSTKERIATLMTTNIDGDSGGALVGHLAVAEIIAAEIDSLAERNAFLLASAEAAQANLAACRRELAEARAFISTIIDAPGVA